MKEPSYDHYLQQQQWAYEDEQIELEEQEEEEEEEPYWLTDPNNVMSRHHY